MRKTQPHRRRSCHRTSSSARPAQGLRNHPYCCPIGQLHRRNHPRRGPVANRFEGPASSRRARRHRRRSSPCMLQEVGERCRRIASPSPNDWIPSPAVAPVDVSPDDTPASANSFMSPRFSADPPKVASFRVAPRTALPRGYHARSRPRQSRPSRPPRRRSRKWQIFSRSRQRRVGPTRPRTGLPRGSRKGITSRMC